MRDGDRATPSSGSGPGGELFVLFCFCSIPGTQNFNKSVVSSVSWSQEEESCELCITGSLPSSSFASGQQWVDQEHRSCPFVEPGKGFNILVLASCCHMPGCYKPQDGTLCFLPHRGNQVTLHFTPRLRPLSSQARLSQASGQIPVFHHTAPPWVCWWPHWFLWHCLSEPGQTRLCDLPPSSGAFRFT